MRLFTLAALVALQLFCRPASALPGSGRTVRVGVYENAPKVFTGRTGRPAGIFIDIIEAIARAEDWSLEYVPGTWAEGMDRLSSGRIDLMVDVAYSAQRDQLFLFHREPVLSSWSTIYAKRGSGIRSILDLEGKRIATLKGSVQQTAFEQFSQGFSIRFSLLPAPDFKKAFEMAARNEADAVICNNYFGLLHGREYGLEDTGIVFNPSKLMFAAGQHFPREMLDAIDRRLIAMKQDHGSEYYRAIRRWTSEEVRYPMPLWVKNLLFLGLIVLVLSLLGSLVLKRQVAQRTRELIQINQEMEKRIDERTSQLAEALEKARAADQIKSAFLATMSHELRTPLNSIIGFTGIMLKGLTGPLNPEQTKQMTMVQNSSRHLLALINDVLDISKIEAGQLVLTRAPFDLGKSIESMVKLVAPMADKKNLRVIVDLPTQVLTVNTDQRRLEQVVLNLLNNAVKFTDAGEVRLTCRVEDEHVVVSFADTGIGIASADLPKLFAPFHQVDSGLTRKRDGTGLGLSICKKILDMMGGTIEVQSSPGQGSTFTFRLPMEAGKVEE